MKARITSDPNHEFGKRFTELFDIDFYSRRNGFDVHDRDNLEKFLSKTHNYELTINFSRAMEFGQTILLNNLDQYCNKTKTNHKVLNIGSYEGTVLMNHPTSGYDVEKATLKIAHRKIATEHMLFEGYLDSYLINLNYLENNGSIIKYHPHINMLDFDSVLDNIKYMLERPLIKEMYVQYKQPGNFRINDGYGIILPGVF